MFKVVPNHRHLDWLRQVRATLVTDAYFEVSWKPCVCNEEKLRYIGLLSYFYVWVPSIGNTFAYELHLFGQFCAAQEATKICRNVYLLLDAVSLTYLSRKEMAFSLYILSTVIPSQTIAIFFTELKSIRYDHIQMWNFGNSDQTKVSLEKGYSDMTLRGHIQTSLGTTLTIPCRWSSLHVQCVREAGKVAGKGDQIQITCH